MGFMGHKLYKWVLICRTVWTQDKGGGEGRGGLVIRKPDTDQRVAKSRLEDKISACVRSQRTYN